MTLAGNQWAADAIAQEGIEDRDPTGDRRLIELLLSFPLEAFSIAGWPRGLARAMGQGLIPDWSASAGRAARRYRNFPALSACIRAISRRAGTSAEFGAPSRGVWKYLAFTLCWNGFAEVPQPQRRADPRPCGRRLSVRGERTLLRWDGPVAGIPDAIVRSVAELPDHLPGAERAGMYAQATPGQLLQMVPGMARYLARDGMTIDVAAEQCADEGAVDVFLNGAVRAALIHQRGELPLHAATLVPPGGNGAVAICGPSGIGKSTLAAALSRRGWLLSPTTLHGSRSTA